MNQDADNSPNLGQNLEVQVRPAVVVAAFNRGQALARLLDSLNRSDCPAGTPLVISIDGGGGEAVYRCAEDFEWQHGSKQIIAHDKNLGLKQHILACGDLTKTFGSIILLEDDLYVTSGFYGYTQDLLERYQHDSRIAGISLYCNEVNHIARLPFTPLNDGYDVYFHQYGASWGQAWTTGQWSKFRAWLDLHLDMTDDEIGIERLPSYIAGWPSGKSWLKYFNLYLVDQQRWIVYPRVSYSTNCGDAGENCPALGSKLQAHLASGFKAPMRLPDFEDSDACYDVYFEIAKHILAKRCAFLGSVDIQSNLYLKKDPMHLVCEKVLVPYPHPQAQHSFGLGLKPIEMNVMMQYPGNRISLIDRDQLSEGRPPAYLLQHLLYYAGPMSVKQSLRVNFFEAKSAFMRRFQ